MDVKYNMKELEGYFEIVRTPEETVAKINVVIAQLTRWFITMDDVYTEIYDFKDCVDFLLDLKSAIGDVRPKDKV